MNPEDDFDISRWDLSKFSFQEFMARPIVNFEMEPIRTHTPFPYGIYEDPHVSTVSWPSSYNLTLFECDITRIGHLYGIELWVMREIGKAHEAYRTHRNVCVRCGFRPDDKEFWKILRDYAVRTTKVPLMRDVGREMMLEQRLRRKFTFKDITES